METDNNSIKKDSLDDGINMDSSTKSVLDEPEESLEQVVGEIEQQFKVRILSDQPKANLDVKPSRGFGKILKSRRFWLTSCLFIFAIMIGAWFIQPARIWLVNAVGLRAKLVVTVQSPISGKQSAVVQNARLQINGKNYTSDQNGRVIIGGQTYGQLVITATKSGYSTSNYTSYLDFDPFFHSLGGQQADQAAQNLALDLESVGVNVSFVAKDWLSGNSILAGEFMIGDVKARPDGSGLVSFKIPFNDQLKATVVSNFSGKYNDKKFDLDLNDKPGPEVSFVPAGRHYYLSRSSGALSVYRSDLDGGNSAELIAGTGRETGQTAFAVSPSGKYGVLASTRESLHGAQNQLLMGLYVVDLDKRSLVKVDQAEQISFVQWSADKLVYRTAGLGPRLKFVDPVMARTADISVGDELTGQVIVAFDQVVYAQVAATADNKAALAARRYSFADSQVREMAANVGDLIQSDFDRVEFMNLGDQKWQEYNFNTNQLKSADQPVAQVGRSFLSASTDAGSKRIMLDEIDGKYAIIVKNTADGTEKQVYRGSGICGPISLMGDVIIYRVVNETETADYVLSIRGGAPKKITDVTATTGVVETTFDNKFNYY